MRVFDYREFNKLANELKLDCHLSGYIYGDKDWRMEPFYNPGHRLYYITKGSAYMYLEDRVIQLEAGNMYLLPRRFPYGFACDGYMEKLFFHFTLHLGQGFEVLDLMKDYVKLPFDSVIKQTLNQLDNDKDFKQKTFFEFQGLVWHSLTLLLKPLTEEIIEKKTRHDPFKTLYDYVGEHCHFGLTVKDLADVMNLSPSYLSKKFNKATGYTVKEYVNSEIIQRAKELLRYSNDTLESISGQLNFTDVFYFSRFFKHHVHMPPSAYRQANQL